MVLSPAGCRLVAVALIAAVRAGRRNGVDVLARADGGAEFAELLRLVTAGVSGGGSGVDVAASAVAPSRVLAGSGGSPPGQAQAGGVLGGCAADRAGRDRRRGRGAGRVRPGGAAEDRPR